MKLSFSSNAYTRYSIFTAVERIAAAGYCGVELLADRPHIFPPTFSDSESKKLQEILLEKSIIVANINANTAMGYYDRSFWEPLFEPSLANHDDKARKWRLDYSKRCVDIACELGSPCISVTSGRMLAGVEPAQSLAHLRSSLEELVSYAENHSIRIGIEYEPGLLISNCNELAAFLDEFGSAFLGANLDLGHSHVLGEDLQYVIRRLGEKIFHIHLEDISWRKHYHLIPGEGEMDFAAIFQALEKQKYDGYITVELYTCINNPDEAAKKALAHLKNIQTAN